MSNSRRSIAALPAILADRRPVAARLVDGSALALLPAWSSIQKWHVIAWVVGYLALACGGFASDDSHAEKVGDAPTALMTAFLPNAVQVTGDVICGGAPVGDEGFRELRQLGVRTIVSVDGAPPNVEAAAKFDLRYVHLPHGYDGISQQRQLELAVAIRELPGPIYIHCHHGKHRSPAAAAVGCVTAGLLASENAIEVLRLGGTSPAYRGLYAVVAAAHPMDEQMLGSLHVEFSSRVAVPPMVETMAAIEQRHDELLTLLADTANLNSVDRHAKAADQALLLREHFTELLRTEDAHQRSVSFVEAMRDAESESDQLHAILAEIVAFGRNAAERGPSTASAAGISWADTKHRVLSAAEKVSSRCVACHQRFRDFPESSGR